MGSLHQEVMSICLQASRLRPALALAEAIGSGEQVAPELHRFMEQLDIGGQGLVEASDRAPLFPLVISASRPAHAGSMCCKNLLGRLHIIPSHIAEADPAS